MSENTTLRTQTWFYGVTPLAKELGVSRYHLAAVLHGRRKAGPELAAKLEGRGIKPETLKPKSKRWV